MALSPIQFTIQPPPPPRSGGFDMNSMFEMVKLLSSMRGGPPGTTPSPRSPIAGAMYDSIPQTRGSWQQGMWGRQQPMDYMSYFLGGGR